MRLPDPAKLPDPARSRVVLIGTATHSAGSDLPNLPAVENNLTDLAEVLADPVHGWLTPESHTIIRNPFDARDLGMRLTKIASEADDLLLIYYAGHGLLDPRGNLHLALTGTQRGQLRYTAFPFDGLRDVFADSPATNRVLILDCCYSGRAIDTMTDPEAAAYDQIEITGTYTLTSTTATTTALAPEGARHTLFTGNLIELLRQGSTQSPDPLTLDHIYRHLNRTLTRANHPRPQQRGTNTTAHLPLVRNPAVYRPLPTREELIERREQADEIAEDGGPTEAVRLLNAIVDDCVRALGPDDRETLISRNELANWTGKAGDPAQARRLFMALVEDDIRVLGPDAFETLTSRHNLADWTGAAGHDAEAVRLFTSVVEDHTRVLGTDDPDTLISRNRLAHWTGKAGDTAEAVRLFTAAVEARARVLGPYHADTLRSRHNLAYWTGKAGITEAVRLFTSVVDARTSALGAEDPATVESRDELTHWTKLLDDLDE